MRIPIFRRISKDDLPGSPPWISFLLNPINSFIENVRQGLGKQITFDENIACQIKDLVFTTSATYESVNDFAFLTFPSTLKTKATGLWVLQISEVHFLPIVKAVSVQWLDDGNGNIKIDFIAGLENETTYLIRVLVI